MRRTKNTKKLDLNIKKSRDLAIDDNLSILVLCQILQFGILNTLHSDSD